MQRARAIVLPTLDPQSPVVRVRVHLSNALETRVLPATAGTRQPLSDAFNSTALPDPRSHVKYHAGKCFLNVPYLNDISRSQGFSGQAGTPSSINANLRYLTMLHDQMIQTPVMAKLIATPASRHAVIPDW